MQTHMLTDTLIEFSAFARHGGQLKRFKTLCLLWYTVNMGVPGNQSGIRAPIWSTWLNSILLSLTGTEWAKKDCHACIQKVKMQDNSLKGNLKILKRTAIQIPTMTLSKRSPFKVKRQIRPTGTCVQNGLRGRRGHMWTLKVSDMPIHKSSRGKPVTPHLLQCLLNGWDPPSTPFSSEEKVGGGLTKNKEWWLSLLPSRDRCSKNICTEIFTNFKKPNCKQVDTMIMFARP